MQRKFLKALLEIFTSRLASFSLLLHLLASHSCRRRVKVYVWDVCVERVCDDNTLKV